MELLDEQVVCGAEAYRALADKLLAVVSRVRASSAYAH